MLAFQVTTRAQKFRNIGQNVILVTLSDAKVLRVSGTPGGSKMSYGLICTQLDQTACRLREESALAFCVVLTVFHDLEEEAR